MKTVAAAARNLRRAPAFTALVVLTLALGIGATTAMFSVVDAVLINPLPFAKADRLVEVWTHFHEGASRTPADAGTIITTLRQEHGLFESLGAYQFESGTMTGAGEPESISVVGVTPSLFTVLPAAPVLGRLFTAADAGAGERVLLITERMWQTRLGGDPRALERTITIDDVPHQVVGVLPARFNFPLSATDAWRPIDIESPNVRTRANVVGIRASGVTPAQVDDRLKVLTASLQDSGALPKGQYLARVLSWQIEYGQRGITSLALLLGAVGVLLLVACVNISNLMLVRASSRRGEFAVMAALGANRSRLLADAAVESVLLAALGGALGLWLAGGLLAAILELAPPNLLMLSAATADLDWRAVLFAIATTLATCVIFSVLPAWRVARLDPIESLKQQSRSTGGRRDDWWQGALVSAQIALVVVLLAGAGVLLRSLLKLNQVDLGFQADGIVMINITMPPRYRQAGAGRAFMREVEQRVEASLGAPATVVSVVPVRSGGYSDESLPEAEGVPPQARPVDLPIARVSGDFFEVLGIPILEGRTFTPDDGEDTIVINDVVAQRYFGRTSPIGRRFKPHTTLPWQTVVGVAADIKTMGPADAIGEGMEVYVPMTRGGDSAGLSLMMRAGRNEQAAIARMKRIVEELDPKLPIVASTMAQQIGSVVARPRFLAGLSGAFTVAAVLIAAVGVYGVTAYWVTRRRRELAIRLAVGASPDRLIATVLGRGLRLTAIGTAIGLAIALAGARVMTSLLFATDPRDPATFAAVTVLLGAVAILACLVPALKAARVDPMTTLRAE